MQGEKGQRPQSGAVTCYVISFVTVLLYFPCLESFDNKAVHYLLSRETICIQNLSRTMVPHIVHENTIKIAISQNHSPPQKHGQEILAKSSLNLERVYAFHQLPTSYLEVVFSMQTRSLASGDHCKWQVRWSASSPGPTIQDVCNVSRFLTPSLLFLI